MSAALVQHRTTVQPIQPCGLVHFPVARDGRWLVCYEVPGTGARAVAEDCPTLEAALQVSRERTEGTRA